MGSRANLGVATEHEQVDVELRARARHLELLNEITSAAIATPDLNKLLQTCADRLGDLWNADGCFITLWDEARRRIIPSAAYGGLREMHPIVNLEPSQVTMTESVLLAGHALSAEDIFHSLYVSPEPTAGLPMKSMLALPLIVGERKLGAVLIAFLKSRHFMPDEVARGEQAARQIALAIVQAQTLAAEQQRAAELEAVHQAGLSLTSSLDLPAVLDAILASAFHLSPDAKDAHIYHYREERLTFAASLWADGQKGHQYAEPRPNGLTYSVARRGEVIVISDMCTHPLFADTPKLGGGALIGIPLKIGVRVVGVMNIAYKDARSFPETELRVLKLLAGQAAIAIENARLFNETKRRAERMAVLNEIGRALTATLKLDQLYRLIFQQTRRVLAVDSFFVALYDEPQSAIHFSFLYDDGKELPNEMHPLGSGPTSHVIQTRASYVVKQSDDPIGQRGSHFGTLDKPSGSAIYVPMLMGRRVIGVISAQSGREQAYQPDDVLVLETIAAQAAIALENARLYDEVRQLAITDELTGLFNRRGLFQWGQREVERALRFQRPLAAVMLDIDHFKRVNDAHGHPVGDRVLRVLAESCRENVRTIDIVGRYGGEEFFLLLPETDLRGAIPIAERLRRSVASAEVLFGRDRIQFTISLGVAELTSDIPNFAVLVERADRAQYLAKQAGRNCVKVYE